MREDGAYAGLRKKKRGGGARGTPERKKKKEVGSTWDSGAEKKRGTLKREKKKRSGTTPSIARNHGYPTRSMIIGATNPTAVPKLFAEAEIAVAVVRS
jgi:hypothetical protein